MVFLYNTSGECIELGRRAWSDALTLALQNGWQPNGTAAPPQCIDVDCPRAAAVAWNHEYEPAAGQTVLRQDAQALGVALAKAHKHEESLSGRNDLVALLRFCRQDGFLISSDPAPSTETEFQESLLGLHSALDHPGRSQPAAMPKRRLTPEPADAPVTVNAQSSSFKR